jgi:hypothetical protein
MANSLLNRSWLIWVPLGAIGGVLVAKVVAMLGYLLASIGTLDPLGSAFAAGLLLYLPARVFGGFVAGLISLSRPVAAAIFSAGLELVMLTVAAGYVGGPEDAWFVVTREPVFVVPFYLIGGFVALAVHRYQDSRLDASSDEVVAGRRILRWYGTCVTVAGYTVGVASVIGFVVNSGKFATAPFWLSCAVYAVTLIGVQAGVGLARWGRRFRAAGRPLPLTVPTFVLLRSFVDDDVELDEGKGIMGLRRLQENRLEAAVASALRGSGEMVAIGRPGEVAPQTGALRRYFTDERWQGEAGQFIDESRALLVVLGKGQGLRWEIETIAARGLLRKVILILPPLIGDEIERRWKWFRETVQGVGVEINLLSVSDDTRVVFFPNGVPQCLSSKKARLHDYECLVKESVQQLGLPPTASK